MNITLLGTGNALVTECYNTCFVINNKNEYFLVDGGGGNTILKQLKSAGINWKDIHNIFVTHKHIDHLMGIIWLVRMICQYMNQGSYPGEARIYAHSELIKIIYDMAHTLLQPKETAFIGKRLHLIPVADKEQVNILGRNVTFFDIHSTKAKQFGFSMDLGEDRKLTCCGDEPCSKEVEKMAEGSEWLMSEAFCLYSQADIFKPYEKHHSTVKDACELAERLGVKNLILYHTEDKNLKDRKNLYLAEGEKFFSGNLFIPDDLDVIKIQE